MGGLVRGAERGGWSGSGRVVVWLAAAATVHGSKPAPKQAGVSSRPGMSAGAASVRCFHSTDASSRPVGLVTPALGRSTADRMDELIGRRQSDAVAG